MRPWKGPSYVSRAFYSPSVPPFFGHWIPLPSCDMWPFIFVPNFEFLNWERHFQWFSMKFMISEFMYNYFWKMCALGVLLAMTCGAIWFGRFDRFPQLCSDKLSGRKCLVHFSQRTVYEIFETYSQVPSSGSMVFLHFLPLGKTWGKRGNPGPAFLIDDGLCRKYRSCSIFLGNFRCSRYVSRRGPWGKFNAFLGFAFDEKNVESELRVFNWKG